MSSLNQPSTKLLILNLMLALGAVLAMNGLIFAFGWSDTNTALTSESLGKTSLTQISTSSAPPGYLVGSMWTVLLALMAIARWRLNFDQRSGTSPARMWLTILIASYLVYPLYSLALNSKIGGLLGNLETIALAIFVVVQA